MSGTGEGGELKSVPRQEGSERRAERHDTQFERMRERIERAPEGGVVFVGDMSAPEDFVQHRFEAHTLDGRSNYAAKLEEELGEDVVLIAPETSAGPESRRSEVLVEVRTAIRENPRAKIIVDFPIALDELLFGEEGGELSQELALAHEGDFGSLFSASAEDEDRSGDLQKTFSATLQRLQMISKFLSGGRCPFSLSVRVDNALIAGFLAFMAFGRADPGTVGTLSHKEHRFGGSTGFITIDGNKIELWIDEKRYERTF